MYPYDDITWALGKVTDVMHIKYHYVAYHATIQFACYVTLQFPVQFFFYNISLGRTRRCIQSVNP